jgi:hypothetical protein
VSSQLCLTAYRQFKSALLNCASQATKEENLEKKTDEYFRRIDAFSTKHSREKMSYLILREEDEMLSKQKCRTLQL